MIGHHAMRRVDRWLGVPGCALLTIVRRACGAMGLRQRSTGPLRRVLFVQLAESGSMVLADPAMRSLANSTGAQPYCVTFAGNRGSLAITATVSEAKTFLIRTASAGELLADACRFLLWVRRNRIDAVIDCELFSRLTAILCLLTGVSSRVGFHTVNGVGLYRGNLYSHPVAFNPHLHMAQNYLRLVAALLGPQPSPASPPPVPRLPLRPIANAEVAAIRARLFERLPAPAAGAERLVVVNANASGLLPQRRWPEAHFVELIRKVLGQFTDVRILLIGAAEDGASTAAIAGKVRNPRCVDVAGWFSVEQLPALFSMSEAMVTNDSGPAHFASVTGLPVIVLFGPETPTLFRPLGNAMVLSAGLACSPCVNVSNQRRTRCTDNQCMQRISVEEVFASTCAVLESSPLRRLEPRRA